MIFETSKEMVNTHVIFDMIDVCLPLLVCHSINLSNGQFCDKIVITRRHNVTFMIKEKVKQKISQQFM